MQVDMFSLLGHQTKLAFPANILATGNSLILPKQQHYPPCKPHPDCRLQRVYNYKKLISYATLASTPEFFLLYSFMALPYSSTPCNSAMYSPCQPQLYSTIVSHCSTLPCSKIHTLVRVRHTVSHSSTLPCSNIHTLVRVRHTVSHSSTLPYSNNTLWLGLGTQSATALLYYTHSG